MEETKSIRELLEEQYRKTLSDVSEAVEGSEEAKLKMQKLNELGKQYQLISQTDSEMASRAFETECKAEQMKENKKDRIVNWFLSGIGVLLPAVLSSYWMGKGMKFEETGSFTSRTMQWVSSHTRLFKK